MTKPPVLEVARADFATRARARHSRTRASHQCEDMKNFRPAAQAARWGANSGNCHRGRNRAGSTVHGRQSAWRTTNMRHKIALLAAAAALMLTGAARADDGDKFLIRGDAAKRMMEQN